MAAAPNKGRGDYIKGEYIGTYLRRTGQVKSGVSTTVKMLRAYLPDEKKNPLFWGMEEEHF